MILLNEITIKNFLSHEKTEISFKQNEKCLIDGRSGSGKSSITEAILWCLYGKGRSDNKSLVRRGSKSASVSIKFIDNSIETIITRSTTSSGKNTLNITQNTGTKGQFLPIEKTGLKDMQNWIETMFLKASYELFTNSIFYPQESESNFVKVNATQRKDLLLEIIRADNFDDLYDKTKKAISSREIKGAGSLARVDMLERDLKEKKEESEKLSVYEAELIIIEKELIKLKETENNISKKLDSISNITTKNSTLKSQKNTLTNSLVAINKRIDDGQKLITELDLIDIITAQKNIEESQKIELEIKNIEKKLEESAKNQGFINSHLSNKPYVIDNSKDIEIINNRLIPLIRESGSCPAGNNCPFVIPIKGQITFLSGQIEEKTKQTQTQKALLKSWEDEFAKLPIIEDTTALYKELNDKKDIFKKLSDSKNTIVEYDLKSKNVEEYKQNLPNIMKEKSEIEIQLQNIETELSMLEQQLKSIDSSDLYLKLGIVKNSISSSQEIKDELSANILVAKKAVEIIKKIKEEINEFKKTSHKIEEERKSLILLKEALSPKGIKAVIIDYLVPQLENKINNVLGQMSEFSIRLDTQQVKASDDGVKEGLFITIKNSNGEELPINNLSGGESVKVKMAIAEGLASIINHIGFRVLDEAITSLDTESTQSFSEVVMSLQDKFPQVFVVSHLQEIKDLFEDYVKLIKVNGISKVLT